MKYFIPTPSTLEELKAMYKRLAMQNHPDRGGSTEAMQEINTEYQQLFDRLKNVHQNAKGEQYTSNTDSTEAPADFIEIIDKLAKLPNIIIELCGSWLWITGETRAVKEELKEIGFRWSSNKKAWYYHEGAYIKRGGKSHSMEEIRDMYGSKQYNGSRMQQLAGANA